MAQQTQLLAALVDGANHRQGGQQNDFQRKLEGFLKLRPPTYDGTDPDPLVADDWLKETEKKLDLLLSPTMSVLELPHTSSQV